MPISTFAQYYAYETVVAVAATAVGSNTAFAVAPTHLVVHCDKDSWVATTSAGAAVAGTGAAGGRAFVAAGERRTLPWASRGFWLVNAVTAELPKARAEGWLA